MVTQDMRAVAKLAAQEAVAETFVMLGLDIKDPISVQKQFAFLSGLYHTRNVMAATVASALVSGIGYIAWTFIKSGAAVAGVR